MVIEYDKNAYCEIKYFVNAFSSLKKDMVNIDTKKFESKFQKYKQNYNGKLIGYCINNYINAELDYETQGDRGIGRMTTFVPRFGAYFRKQLCLMPKGDISTLFMLIQDILIRGYLGHLLFMEESIKKSKLVNKEKLFQEWIPGIYGQHTSKLPDYMNKIFTISVGNSFKETKEFILNHGMKGGGFLSKDRTDEILFYYLFAGYGLRLVETRGY